MIAGPATPEMRARFADVLVAPPAVTRTTGIGVAAVVGCLVFAILIGVALNLSAPGFSALIAVTVALSAIVIISVAFHSIRRKVRSLVTESTDLQVLIHNISTLGVGSGLQFPALELARSVSKVGRNGLALRIRNRSAPLQAEPIQVRFEPRVLDESDQSFLRFEREISGRTYDDQTQKEKTPVSVRFVRRNLLLKGGYAFAILCAINLIAQGFDAYSKGKMTWQLAIWVFNTLGILLIPLSGTWSKSLQWLIVPGGLLLRRASRFGKKSEIHLFTQATGVICLYERRRSTWLLAAADPSMSASAYLTDAEATMLLRAWLSPLDPPPVESLVDYQ